MTEQTEPVYDPATGYQDERNGVEIVGNSFQNLLDSLTGEAPERLASFERIERVKRPDEPVYDDETGKLIGTLGGGYVRRLPKPEEWNELLDIARAMAARLGDGRPGEGVVAGLFCDLGSIDADLAAMERATDALREIAEQQQKTVGWMREHGIVFDGPLGTDPANWENVAFSVYGDLCEVDSLARAVLAGGDGHA